MSALTLYCPSCGGKNENLTAAGKLAVCRYCGAGIPLPETAPDAPAAPEYDSWIAAQLPRVEEAIIQLEDNLQTDKARLKEAARKIWLHALKKKDGDWDEVTRELAYLVREAKTIFDAAAGFLVDPRSEVRDYIEPLVVKTRQSADARPLFETVQSFGQAMAESQGGALPENLNDFSLPPLGGRPGPAPRPAWIIPAVIGGVSLCLCCGVLAAAGAVITLLF